MVKYLDSVLSYEATRRGDGATGKCMWDESMHDYRVIIYETFILTRSGFGCLEL